MALVQGTKIDLNIAFREIKQGCVFQTAMHKQQKKHIPWLLSYKTPIETGGGGVGGGEGEGCNLPLKP